VRQVTFRSGKAHSPQAKGKNLHPVHLQASGLWSGALGKCAPSILPSADTLDRPHLGPA